MYSHENQSLYCGNIKTDVAGKHIPGLLIKNYKLLKISVAG
jgi:hypothetical protein